MGRYSPTVLPTVTEDPFAAGFSGLRSGFDLGQAIAERRRQRKRDERADTRSDTYLDIQKGYAKDAGIGAAIGRAREGYGVSQEGQDLPEDAITVEGGGYLSYDNSMASRIERERQRRAIELDQYNRMNRDADTEELEGYIRSGDEASVIARSPGAAGAMRQGPVVGSPEWERVEKFRTDERIRQDRARPRSYGGGTSDPRWSQISGAIDDARIKYDRALRREDALRPRGDFVQPSDTLGFGQATRDRIAAESRYDALERRQGMLFPETAGVPEAPPPPPPPGPGLSGRKATGPMGPPLPPKAAEAQAILNRIHQLNVPEEEKERLRRKVLGISRSTSP